MGNRGPEKGHNPIAHDLIHGAFEAVHRVHHAFEDRVEEVARFLGVALGQQLHGALQVGKQHRDLLAFAFKGRLRGQDLLGQMAGCVLEGGRGSRGWRLFRERSGALPAKGKSRRIVKAALRAAPAEWAGTLSAKLHAFRILKSTARATHGYALQHSRASGWSVRGQVPRRARLLWPYGMRCQYSRCGQVSSEKHETAAEARADEEG
jgi:hypothetical protein